MYYAGIGSRKTPQYVLDLIKQAAAKLAQAGFTLRSGGALGADDAFFSGCMFAKGNNEIFYTDYYTVSEKRENYSLEKLQEATKIAESFHPGWDWLREYARKLMVRNTFQVLGKDLDTPSKFILCWTPDGSTGKTTVNTGGTGQAIRIADNYKIPVFNLALEEHTERIKAWL